MNYSRIYSDFIEDRRSKESKLVESGEYRERHHIAPRCLGGTDDADNLITLTPEDHFFAHLLLAKIHGGKLWAPIAFMVGGTRKDYKPTQSRVKHGWAARALAKSISGDLSYQFDFVEYLLRHVDGRSWSGKQSEMLDGVGISKSLANMLIKGRISVAKGWYMDGRPPKKRGGSSHPMYRSEAHHFAHVDGREFIGTQHEFHKSCGVSKPAASKLASKEAIVWNGWHLKGADLPKIGKGSRWRFGGKSPKPVKGPAFRFQKGSENNLHTDHTLYKFLVIETGEVIECKKYGIRQRFGISSAQLSTLFTGRQKKTHGISLSDPLRPKAKAEEVAGTSSVEAYESRAQHVVRGDVLQNT